MEAAEHSFDLKRMLWGDYSWVIHSDRASVMFSSDVVPHSV